MTAVANAAVKTSLFQAPATTIVGEPVALYSTTAKSLLQPIRRVISVYRYDPSTGLKVEYSASDYDVIGGGIARSIGSSIYDFSSYSITMTGGTYELATTAPRNPPPVLNLLTYVDYETDYLAPVTINGSAAPAVDRLIITAGDSITGGASTISRDFFESDADGYVGLLRSHFYKQFGVHNFSFDGSTIGELTSGLSGLLAMNPSVLTVAFGQNDHVAGPAGLSSFSSALTDIVDDCQMAGVRVILIGFMPKNPLWENYSLTDCIAYNDAISDVATAKSVPFVDIYTRWNAIKALKSHIELTGDNHHHPNNFGARIYFSAILPHLLTGSISSVDVAAYVREP